MPNAEATHGRLPNAQAPPGFSRQRILFGRKPKRRGRQKQAGRVANLDRDLERLRDRGLSASALRGARGGLKRSQARQPKD
jgi:hypothetical protein